MMHYRPRTAILLRIEYKEKSLSEGSGRKLDYFIYCCPKDDTDTLGDAWREITVTRRYRDNGTAIPRTPITYSHHMFKIDGKTLSWAMKIEKAGLKDGSVIQRVVEDVQS